MDEERYEYDNALWRPQPTGDGPNSFFHAVFGNGDPCYDADANYRRLRLTNYINYIEVRPEMEHARDCLPYFHGSRRELAYEIERLSSHDEPIFYRDIDFIATLENIKIVLLSKKGTQVVYNPNERLLAGYPWRVSDDAKEVVICFNPERWTYSRLYRGELIQLPTEELTGGGESIQDVDEQLQEFSAKKYYTKLTGSAGIKGVLYQIYLLTIFLINATKKFDIWRLSTENKAMGVFDDVVLEIPLNGAHLLQSKHKQNRRINYDQLLSSADGDFSLPKYYFSYLSLSDISKIKIEKLSLCTDTELNLPESCQGISSESLMARDLLYIPNLDCDRYTFNESIIPDFKQKVMEYRNNNLTDTTLGDDVLEEDKLKEFLSLFQLVTKYPSTGYLDAYIEKLLCKASICKPLETKDCCKYLIDKIMKWFENRENKNEYLTQNTVKIFMNEFRSNKFCEKLGNFHIRVERDDFDYNAARLLRIKSSKGYILNMIKIYQMLYSGDEQYLFLNPEEEERVQMQMVEMFESTSYKVLVARFNISNSNLLDQLAGKLTSLLGEKTWKKVILITGEDDRLASLLEARNGGIYQEKSENITFSDLTKDSQKILLKRIISNVLNVNF